MENRIDIDTVGDMGETALHVALYQNNEILINALLNANARIDIESEFGKTAMYIALDRGINLSKDT